MLVCNVSLRPPRSAIAADLTEVVAATDATATGNVVFAALVDNPASVGEIIDAYLGEIMLEAASADAVADAGLVYVAGIDEGLTITEVWGGDVPTIYTAAIVEAATAYDIPDAGTAAAAAVTAMSTTAIGPLFVFDSTFPRSSLTVINVGR